MKLYSLIICYIFYQTSFAATGYNLAANANSVVVNEFSNCKRLTNTSSKSYFVPTGKSADWTNFLNHLPPGVSTSDCIWYEWTIGAWGSCNGGTGWWAYGTWSSCSGGSSSWQYGSWGSCSASCGGGTMTRSATCGWSANSGSQSRGSTCSFNPNSGTQTRSVVCKRNDGVTVADSFCTTAKPSTTQACTPTNSSVCGTAVTSQACTPSTTPSCSGSPTTSSSCNTQACCTLKNKMVCQPVYCFGTQIPTGPPMSCQYDYWNGSQHCWGNGGTTLIQVCE